MTNRIDRTFSALRERQEKALITYITAGDPDLAATADLVLALERAGADLIELGVPFSDPIADGPVIQLASQRALEAGTNLRSILKTVQELREKTQIPIILMTYYNPVFRFGLGEFAQEAGKAGVDGLIIPDLPFEEKGSLENLLIAQEICLIPLLAPTSTEERIAKIAAEASGFIYCVSLTGVTGVRRELPPDIDDFIARVQQYAQEPVAIGFGVSDPEQARRFAGLGDGVIVGSAIVQRVADNQADRPKMLAEVESFVRTLAQGVKGA